MHLQQLSSAQVQDDFFLAVSSKSGYPASVEALFKDVPFDCKINSAEEGCSVILANKGIQLQFIINDIPSFQDRNVLHLLSLFLHLDVAPKNIKHDELHQLGIKDLSVDVSEPNKMKHVELFYFDKNAFYCKPADILGMNTKHFGYSSTYKSYLQVLSLHTAVSKRFNFRALENMSLNLDAALSFSSRSTLQ